MDPTIEDQIRIYKTKKSILDRQGACGAADRGVESLRFQIAVSNPTQAGRKRGAIDNNYGRQ